MNQIYYYDKSGRKYKGKERICPTCNKKEVVRDSNNSKQCQECQRPQAISEVTYIDKNGDKYPGRYKKCKGCGKESIVRMINKTEYCRQCIQTRKKSCIKKNELTIERKDGRIQRATKITCPECKKERIVRNDFKSETNICFSCRASKHFKKLGKQFGGYNYKTGIGNYRNKKLNLFRKECECCGIDDDINNLIIVHHIDGDRNNNEIENLLILCSSCHRAIHIRINKGLSIEEAFNTVQYKKMKYPGKWKGKHLPND